MASLPEISARETSLLPSWEIRQGNALDRLREMPDESVQCCVTSPPYFGLRDYGAAGQIGLESSLDDYVAALVAVFTEVRRVLREDGTLWLNLGDSYNADGRKGRAHMGIGKNAGYTAWVNKTVAGTKPKDLLGVPWFVAFALRSDGWYLRSEIIWHKPSPIPESVKDRPTRSHEHLFLLSRSPRYFYDADAIREDHVTSRLPGAPNNEYSTGSGRVDGGVHHNGSGFGYPEMGRNKRDVWTIGTQPFGAAHFATFPPKLVEPCILAGSGPGDTVLDPFSGSGTTGMVALRHGRSYVGIELNPEYVELSRRRIGDDAPLLNMHGEVADVAA